MVLNVCLACCFEHKITGESPFCSQTCSDINAISRIKSEDSQYQMVDMRDMCARCVDEAYSIGIKVVDDVDPARYAAFLAEREVIVAEQKAEIQAAKEAKLLRTAVAEAKASAS